MQRTRPWLLGLALWMAGGLALTAAGCSLFDGGDDPALVETTWRLRAFLADDELPSFDDPICPLDGVDCVSDDRTYTVVFQPDGGLGVQADCNTCGGSYARDGRRLQVEGVFCTEVYCGEASRGAAFAQALGAARGFRLRDGWLLIVYGDGHGLLLRATSSRAEAPPRSR